MVDFSSSFQDGGNYKENTLSISLLKWWTFHLLFGTGGTTRRIHYLNERTVTVAATVEADSFVKYG